MKKTLKWKLAKVLIPCCYVTRPLARIRCSCCTFRAVLILRHDYCWMASRLFFLASNFNMLKIFISVPFQNKTDRGAPGTERLVLPIFPGSTRNLQLIVSKVVQRNTCNLGCPKTPVWGFIFCPFFGPGNIDHNTYYD